MAPIQTTKTQTRTPQTSSTQSYFWPRTITITGVALLILGIVGIIISGTTKVASELSDEIVKRSILPLIENTSFHIGAHVSAIAGAFFILAGMGTYFFTKS